MIRSVLVSRNFLFLLGTTRPGGNTEALARLAAEQLPADVGQTWLRLDEHVGEPFRDVRHEGDGIYPAPVGGQCTLLEATLAATDLVIASPLYWFTVSASVKAYLDHWSAWMRVPGVDFRKRMGGKTMWAITAHTAKDPSEVEPMLGTLRLVADYLGMRWGGELLAYGNRPGEAVASPDVAVRAHELFEVQPVAC
jgi:multimeric flavodoxin WrbA